jgi:two-component system, OmpR family, response regulator CpxR
MMSVITIFSGIFCSADAVIQQVMTHTGYRLITDEEIIGKATEMSAISEEKIRRVFSAKASVFNPFTHERECATACLRLALAKELEDDRAIVHGFSGLLIPPSVKDVLRVCITADLSYRIQRAATLQRLPENEALFQVRAQDAQCAVWTKALYSVENPWTDGLYDLVLPMDRVDAASAGTRIEEGLIKHIADGDSAAIQAQKDFLLAATVEMALCKAGHNVSVAAEDGLVTLTIDKQVPMRSRLEAELKTIAGEIPGVCTVTTRVLTDDHQALIYRKHRPDMPSRVLLVDDEREFVQTLSERLQLRQIGSAVVYDGESALTLIEEDEPEMLIIDLKMPGIGGMEILKHVKATRPAIEVIVLTGHGTEADRQRCMSLGAFAYMQKPVDIEDLSVNLKKAHEKIRKSNA